MPIDIDKIRALLASVAGFTEGPWHMEDASKAPPGDEWGEVVCRRHPAGGAGTPVPGMRLTWGVRSVGAVAVANARIVRAAPDMHRELTEAVGEIERLRAHNARMVALLSKIADAMDAADREPTWSDGMIVVTDSLPDATDLRRLAAGEVDDV